LVKTVKEGDQNNRIAQLQSALDAIATVQEAMSERKKEKEMREKVVVVAKELNIPVRTTFKFEISKLNKKKWLYLTNIFFRALNNL
jgi:hypothetical protein